MTTINIKKLNTVTIIAAVLGGLVFLALAAYGIWSFIYTVDPNSIRALYHVTGITAAIAGFIFYSVIAYAHIVTRSDCENI